MTQFHQEEQRRFEEKFIQQQDKTFTDKEGYYQHTENFLSFNRQSNERAMKHILEELLAEIPEDEKIPEPCPKEEYGTLEEWERCETCDRERAINYERRSIRAAITKKLSDIALEE